MKIFQIIMCLLENSLQDGKLTVPVAIIRMDSTDLKKLNDDYGHEVGNQAIRVFGQNLLRLCHTLEEEGLAALGFRCYEAGDEFGLILIGATQERVWEIQEFLSHSPPMLQINKQKTEVISCTSGVAHSNDPDISEAIPHIITQKNRERAAEIFNLLNQRADFEERLHRASLKNKV